jgi:hypothetical protein
LFGRFLDDYCYYYNCCPPPPIPPTGVEPIRDGQEQGKEYSTMICSLE